MYQHHSEIKIFELKPDNSYQIHSLPEVVNGRVDPTNYKYSFVGDYDGDCQTDLILLVESDSNSLL